MDRTRSFLAVVSALTICTFLATAVPRDVGAADAVPGITDTEIVLGGTHPFSGPASAYGIYDKGIQAYFAYVNDRGGVNGCKIVYKDLDDAYRPPQTVQLVKQLVEQDHVFAIFNARGTPSNIALRAYLNDNRVPQLFIATGATTWGMDAKKFPWTIGFQPDYQAEAVLYGKDALTHRTNTKLAVFYQNDDFGKDYVTGFTRGLGARANQIVKTASYEVSDPDVRSQIATLKGSGADTLLIAATPKFATQALVAVAQQAWKPSIYFTNVSVSQTIMRAVAQQGGPDTGEGVVTAIYVIDPTNPTYAASKGMALYKTILTKYQPGGDQTNGFLMYAMAAAYTMVDTLKLAGRDITRDKVMDRASHLNERDNPFLLPGIVVQTSPDDRFPIRQEQLARFTSGTWQPFGSVIDARK